MGTPGGSRGQDAARSPLGPRFNPSRELRSPEWEQHRTPLVRSAGQSRAELLTPGPPCSLRAPRDTFKQQTVLPLDPLRKNHS